MYELHVKAFFEFRRKFAKGRRNRIHVVMTDRAHRLLFGIRKLADVAPDARIVTRELEIGRFPLAPVTRVAFELGMLGNGV